jgi:hypothetical protein
MVALASIASAVTAVLNLLAEGVQTWQGCRRGKRGSPVQNVAAEVTDPAPSLTMAAGDEANAG